jgi:hypothetical protein
MDSDKVTRASGMVSVQAACTVREAIVLMRARADRYPSETLESIAAAVIDGRIRFGDA